MTDDQGQVVFRTHSVGEAHIVRGVLQAAGIQSFLYDENLIRIDPLLSYALGGIRVVVSAEDYSQAEELLQSHLDTSEKGPFFGKSGPISSFRPIPMEYEHRELPEEEDRLRLLPAGFDSSPLLVIAVFIALVGLAFGPYKLSSLWQSPHRATPWRPQLINFRPDIRQQIMQPFDTLRAKAQNGDAEAQRMLGWKCLIGFGVQSDDSEALRWIEASTRQGNRKAIDALGQFYEHGWGTKRDLKQAVFYFRKAADEGEPQAEMHLGWCYQKGQGISHDPALGFSWIQKAADAGFYQADGALGYSYAKGLGVPKDDAAAVAWFRKGADQGDPGAQGLLGYSYMSGTGVPQDYSEAARLLERAGLHGDGLAQYYLGRLYQSGQGVQKDFSQALAWYLLSAARGVDQAQEAAEHLRDHMSPLLLHAGEDSAARYEERIQALAVETSSSTEKLPHL